MNKVYTHAQLLEDEAKKLEDNQLEGTVTITIPMYPERIRLPKELGIDKLSSVSKSKLEDGSEDDLNMAMSGMEFIANAAEKIHKYVVEVDLKHKVDGDILKTADDLYSHPDGGDLITALVNKFVSGFLGKKTAQPSGAK